jgi:hypothetical protein
VRHGLWTIRRTTALYDPYPRSAGAGWGERRQEPLPADTPSRAVDERATLLKEAQLKAEQAEQTAAAVAAAVATGDAAAILQAAKDPLADALDVKLGHTVTDHAVFDQHARKFERMYLEDMDALGVRRPDVMTRVSEYVPQVRDCHHSATFSVASQAHSSRWVPQGVAACGQPAGSVAAPLR